jgi:hypothetical protein
MFRDLPVFLDLPDLQANAVPLVKRVLPVWKAQS